MKNFFENVFQNILQNFEIILLLIKLTESLL